MEAFMGTIMAVGFNYAPRGWAFCNGQLVPIAQNSAMFALLGTMYGGDGFTTFGLPDLRGRVAVGSQGNGPGLQPVSQGERAGTNNVTVIANGTTTVNVTTANLPAHTHPATMSLTGLTGSTTINVNTTTTTATTTMTANSSLSQAPTGAQTAAAIFSSTAANVQPLGGVTTTVGGSGTVTVNANTGGGMPVLAPVTTQALASVMQPYIGLNYIICMEGIFPSRN